MHLKYETPIKMTLFLWETKLSKLEDAQTYTNLKAQTKQLKAQNKSQMHIAKAARTSQSKNKKTKWKRIEYFKRNRPKA